MKYYELILFIEALFVAAALFLNEYASAAFCFCVFMYMISERIAQAVQVNVKVINPPAILIAEDGEEA
jgi:archaellum component FlaG (FlaF/FlaG flagellin family)